MTEIGREQRERTRPMRPHHPTTSLLGVREVVGVVMEPNRDSRRDMTEQKDLTFNDVPDDEYVVIPYTASPDAKWGWQ